MGYFNFTMRKTCPTCGCRFTITSAASVYCQNKDCQNKRRRERRAELRLAAIDRAWADRHEEAV